MRKFFRQLGRDTAEAALTPVLKWIAHKDQGSSELLVMCWDRHELLAKIAGVLAAQNINILGADLFLRKDSLVLDIFRVCTTKLEPVTNQTTIDKVQAMVEAVFTGKEIDLAAQIAKHTAQQGSQPPLEWQREFPIRVHVSNELHPDYTTVEIQALDRIGLLWSIFQSIGRLGLEITHARINTEKGAAIDTLYVAGSDGRKITDANVLRELADRVSEVVGIQKGG
jgi:[protein-PII] uridylyltransferase